MPITYGNANYRRKFEAFDIVDKSGTNPLERAIELAHELQGKEAFDAWIKVCEFVYAKPKFVEQTAEQSVQNATAAQETLAWMERVAAGANGIGSQRSDPSRMDGRQSQIQAPSASTEGP